jgi:hypothetical protein
MGRAFFSCQYSFLSCVFYYMHMKLGMEFMPNAVKPISVAECYMLWPNIVYVYMSIFLDMARLTEKKQN